VFLATRDEIQIWEIRGFTKNSIQDVEILSGLFLNDVEDQIREMLHEMFISTIREQGAISTQFITKSQIEKCMTQEFQITLNIR
jgi:hypothetical protein